MAKAIYSSFVTITKEKVKNAIPSVWHKLSGKPDKPKESLRVGIHYFDDGDNLIVYTIEERDAQAEIALMTQEEKADFLLSQWVIDRYSPTCSNGRRADLGIVNETKAVSEARHAISIMAEVKVPIEKAYLAYPNYKGIIDELYTASKK